MSDFSLSVRWLLCAVVALLCMALLSDPVRADQSDPEIDGLFEELEQAQGPAEVKLIENQILDKWRDPNSDSIDLLMNRGIVAMSQGDFETALLHFDDVVELAPNYAEGWNRRATLFFLMERYDDSIMDIERTVALEPRHFAAWSGLGKVFLELGFRGEALRAIRKAVEVHPHLEGAQELIEELTLEVEGQGI